MKEMRKSFAACQCVGLWLSICGHWAVPKSDSLESGLILLNKERRNEKASLGRTSNKTAKHSHSHHVPGFYSELERGHSQL